MANPRVERPPSKTEIAAARRRLERSLGAYGLLLLHDAQFPSATACIAGEVIRGSWWGHAKGKLIYETLTQIGDDVAWAKLVCGKATLVHRRLWPALVAVATSGQPWQTDGLRADARRLLARVGAGGRVATDAAPAVTRRKLAAAATELERRLLAHANSDHTASGHHARFLETWQAWGRRNGIGVTRGDLPAVADGIQALSAPVIAWASDLGRRPPGLLPWLATR
jgi:hypothetical protein